MGNRLRVLIRCQRHTGNLLAVAEEYSLANSIARTNGCAQISIGLDHTGDLPVIPRQNHGHGLVIGDADFLRQ